MSDDENRDNMNDDDDIDLELDMEGNVKEIESKEVENLKVELKKIIEPKIAPPMFPPHPVKCPNPEQFPESYNSNTKKEELVLEYVKNFKNQFTYIYPDRKTLFMSPYNECGIEKFVCTTIRPTTLKYSKIYDWEECARFVSDYLQFMPLADPTELPLVLWSETQVLKEQKGNCFDFSFLLASLLIGHGYDAYVVSGYATREVCNADQSRKMCPLLLKEAQKKEEATKREQGKYVVKPPKDMNSKYLIAQDNRAKKKLFLAAEKQRLDRERYLAELEKPPVDPLYGLRVHSWVLVLSGKREVPETFFIESLTGCAVSTKDDDYLGIESVWNHKNYWVNMQSCADGTAGLVFDLGDSARWEYMLPSNEKPILLVPNLAAKDDDPVDEARRRKLLSPRISENESPRSKRSITIANKNITLKERIIDDEIDPSEVEKHLDLPASWVDQINITHKEFERRCPEGKKVILYKKCKVEKFAPYLLKDNMILKITEYSDNEMKELKQITEEFFHRKDKIKRRVTDFVTGWVVETFDRGRSKFLKEHKYQQTKTGPENERVMYFYDDARVDGLKCREESPTEMVEHFVKRPDFLYYRRVTFEKRVKRFGPQESDNSRNILKIVERYSRNLDKKAHEDIHELVFNIEAEKFQIIYHRESTKIAPSTREFMKPSNWNDKGQSWTWSTDLHQSYQAGSEHKSKKNVDLFLELTWLMNQEEIVKNKVRKSEEEVNSILTDRTNEEAITELTVSIYDTERNQKARQYKTDLEKKIAEEKLRKQTLDVDYLAPFLALKGITEKQPIRPQDAIELKERCLADLKNRLIDNANLIQKRFETESNELQKKQQWYQANQINMSRDDEQEYLEYCAEAMFRIHILELRLNRHKEKAPIKYQEMESELTRDPRLNIGR